MAWKSRYLLMEGLMGLQAQGEAPVSDRAPVQGLRAEAD